MAITVSEKPDSRSAVDGVSTELLYFAEGSADEAAIITAVAAEAPGTHNDLVRGTISVEPVYVDSENPDSCEWDATVPYAPAGFTPFPAEGTADYQFDIGGATQHITQSKETVAKYAPSGETATDHKGAIGVSDDGIAGVDIDAPTFEWSETHTLAAATVTTAYKAILYGLCRRTYNNASFRGFAAGEVRLLSVSGSKRADGLYDLTFKFSATPNRTNFTIGDITVAAKLGWHYMWVQYEPAEDTTAKRLALRPIAVYIEKVYDEGNYSNLAIGTAAI